jgi:hypothetical protein
MSSTGLPFGGRTSPLSEAATLAATLAVTLAAGSIHRQ